MSWTNVSTPARSSGSGPWRSPPATVRCRCSSGSLRLRRRSSMPRSWRFRPRSRPRRSSRPREAPTTRGRDGAISGCFAVAEGSSRGGAISERCGERPERSATELRSDLAERVDDAGDLLHGVVVTEADPHRTSRRLQTESLHPLERVVVAVPDVDAALAESNSGPLGGLVAEADRERRRAFRHATRLRDPVETEAGQIPD